MKTTEVKTIGVRDYEFTQLGVKKSLAVLTRLTRLIGPGLGDIEVSGDETKGKKTTGLNVGSIIEAVTTRLDEDTVIKTISDLLESVNVQAGDGFVRANMEFHFSGAEGQGNLGDLLKVVAEALKVNYSDFLQSLRDIRGSAGATIPTPKSKGK